MRSLTVLLLVAAMSLPFAGAKDQSTQKVTVAQLGTAVATAQAKPDAEAAQQLAGLELNERLSSVEFSRLESILPGELSRRALTALADSSEFLPLPASEIPSMPPLTPAEQRRVMALVVTYVTQTVHQLPNFVATRATARFEDRPEGNFGYLPLHFVSKSSKSVIYRDGQEQAVAASAKAKSDNTAAQGMVSWGEFGPILSTVLLDAAQSKLAWSHWEPSITAPVAVFAYDVPEKTSHYLVQYCCVDENNDPSDYGTTPFRKRAGYHGQVSVDPATGAILRITVEAQLASDDPINRAAIMVRYGAIDIGGRTFTCPVRSVALSVVRYGHSTLGFHSSVVPGLHKKLLNDVDFDQYHRLFGEARILTAEEGQSSTSAADASREISAETSAQPLPAAANDSAIQPAANPPQSDPSTETALVISPAPATVAQPAVPEISVAAAENIPDVPINSPASQQGAFVLKMTSRLVDVGVVVVDKKGHPVRDLKPADFEVDDNGHKQQIKFFNEFASGPAVAKDAPAAAAPVRTFSNQSSDPSLAGTTHTAESNTTILLLDESHIAWSDLTHARQEVIKFLDNLPAGERVGIYTMTALNFRVLKEITTDHPALIASLKKWMPTAHSVSLAQEDETRNRQQFETVHRPSDLASVNGNQNDAPDAGSPVDPQLMTLGNNPGRASLVILRSVARSLAAIPGHKNLIWISSDNVFVNWNDITVGVNKDIGQLDVHALRAQEAMNEAHVAVYPFDVSQLEGGTITADLKNRNVELDPTAGDSPREMDAGRIKASMLQDLRPIQGPIRQLAEATGGRTVRRSSDLAVALASIVEDGHATYQLSFYPDTPADDKYHPISLKIVDKKGLTVRGRTGYLYSKEPVSMKERFQQAIWRPADASEIRLTAETDTTQSGMNLKIHIAESDLSLEQHADRWMDKLDIFLVERDAGLHAQVEGRTMGLRLQASTFQKLLAEGIPFEQVVKLKPGTATLRVVVIDENSGRIGSLTIPASALGATPSS